MTKKCGICGYVPLKPFTEYSENKIREICPVCKSDPATRLQNVILHDETAKEWADRMSEFEYCSSCGCDINDPKAHDIIVFMGNWFARCKGGNTE